MAHGLYHLYKRKRIHQKGEPYPHPDKFKRFIDKVAFLGGLFFILFTLPQLTRIWIDKVASGVSIITWVGYFFGAVFWVTYGIMHKEKPLIFNYSVAAILDILIVIGVFIYG